MIELLAKIGRFNTVVIISLTAAVIAIAVTVLAATILKPFGIQIDLSHAIAFAGSVPLIVAPIITWPLIGLMLRIYRMEEEMRDLASHDSLTGLLSRLAFFDNANNYISLAQRDGSQFSVLIVDLDHFKTINDQYGHPAGDAVLRLFADVVNSVSRRSDIIGRLGGEEFALMLPSTGAQEAVEFCERLHQAIKKAVLKHNHDMIRYTVSIGLASYLPDSDEGIDSLLARADIALYQAKRNGRNQTAVYRDDEEQVAVI